MTAKVTGLRSIELGVTDLTQSAAFYNQVWGLEPVVSEADTIHLRATGAEHHIVTLRERPTAGMLGVHFAAQDRHGVDELYAKAKASGANVNGAPAELPRTAGGGYGFQFRTPEGHTLNVAADVAQHPNMVSDRSKPCKLSHVVINSAKIGDETAYFMDMLGFKLSDSTHMMDFIRCCADHHSIALARSDGPSLNHMAYEMTNMDGLMRGAGRMKHNGFNVEWGVGRHGPGDNVFSYFIEPNGFVTEYTAEVEQVDDSYVAHDAQWWIETKLFPCRWKMAGAPSDLARKAMGGELVEEENLRCEQVMARALGR
jgi:catechol 2,3-dioxygenase